jgi:uncharacterized protein involved in exopolysaccharide biosynthesis
MDTDLVISQALWRALYARNILVAGVIFASATTALLVCYLLTPIYKTEATLIPTETAGSSGVLQRLGELGGLASLAGLAIDTNGKQTTESIALIRSRQFAMAFISDENLLPVLFAKKWDQNRHAWKVSGDNIPTENDAYEYFDKKVRSVSEDKKTSLITLTIKWRDRRLAAAWAAELITRLNNEMRARAIRESNASIALLNEQLASTSVIPLQQSLSALIEAQVKQRTFALVRPDFAFRIIDPAVIPDAKDYIFPKRVVFVLFGIVAGLILAIFMVLPTALRLQQNTVDRRRPPSG